jgi:hypothetical protein
MAEVKHIFHSIATGYLVNVTLLAFSHTSLQYGAGYNTIQER